MQNKVEEYSILFYLLLNRYEIVTISISNAITSKPMFLVVLVTRCVLILKCNRYKEKIYKNKEIVSHFKNFINSNKDYPSSKNFAKYLNYMTFYLRNMTNYHLNTKYGDILNFR